MKSLYAHAQGLPQHAVKWTGGFWKNRFDLVAHTMVPHMYTVFASDQISHVLANFMIAAGKREGTHKGPSFSDGDFYKWLEGASYAYGVSHDNAIKCLIDEAILIISRAQRADGYIGTKQTIEDRLSGTDGALSNSLNFEAYNIGHLMSAACVHYRATKETSLLMIATKAADYLSAAIHDASQKGMARTAVCPSHYMGFIELYRTTKDARYLEAAALAIALRDTVEHGTDDNQDRLPLREHRQAVGHAVRANYLYAGVADLYAEQGDASLLLVLYRVWKDVVETKLAFTGGCGALYDGVSPYGGWDYEKIQRTHQCYGRPYELPNITSYNETCAAVGNILWNWRMFLIEPQAIYFDIIERTFYNLILASTSIDGEKYFYQNALRRELVLPFDLKWSRKREPYISSFCCPPNMLRTLSESAMYAYAQGESDLYIGLYGENRATCAFDCGVSFTIDQKTCYPWDGTIMLSLHNVQGNAAVTIHIRIPSWATGALITLHDGRSITLDEKAAGTYLPINKQWHDGETIHIQFPMEASLYTAHRLVEEDNNHVAVQRGPIVYCIESCDFPDVEVFHRTSITNRPNFTSEHSTIDGLPLVCLYADAIESDIAGRQNDGLYQRLVCRVPEKRRIRLIPYFAWDNRGFHAMKVWIPLHICE